MEYKVRILETGTVTHNVMRFVVEKPPGYRFKPGQATLVSIDRHGLENEKRPFTFTSLAKDKNLEFIIKIYPEHKGMTEKLGRLKKGDGLILRDVWGAITYKGPGVFIAGGAGITPFIAILRQLRKEDKVGGNKLIFSNKTEKDVILEKELKEMLGEELVLTLTKEKKKGYLSGRIDKRFLEKNIEDFSQNFYVCGPKKFVADIKKTLEELGARMIVVEI